MILSFKRRKVHIDQADLDKVTLFSQNNIHLAESRNGDRQYVVIKKAGKVYQVARLIMGIRTKTKKVLFRDGNSLNLTRKNLEVVDAGVASRRRTKLEGTSSKYIGVHFSAYHGRFRACIRPKKGANNEHLGYFDKERDAAKAYDAAAKKYHKERATLNFK